jgi:hypothetical protein
LRPVVVAVFVTVVAPVELRTMRTGDDDDATTEFEVVVVPVEAIVGPFVVTVPPAEAAVTVELLEIEAVGVGVAVVSCVAGGSVAEAVVLGVPVSDPMTAADDESVMPAPLFTTPVGGETMDEFTVCSGTEYGGRCDCATFMSDAYPRATPPGLVTPR